MEESKREYSYRGLGMLSGEIKIICNKKYKWVRWSAAARNCSYIERVIALLHPEVHTLQDGDSSTRTHML